MGAALLGSAVVGLACRDAPAPKRPDAPDPIEEPDPDFIGEGAWSPDGRRIVVSRLVRGRFRLYGLFAPDAGRPPPFPSTGVRVSEGRHPAWAPDGMWIAFQSTHDGNGDVYRMRPDGQGPENLTRHPAEDATPTYGPGGRRIAFVSDRGGRHRIWTMRADGSDPRLLANVDVRAGGLAWSPAGTSIAVHAYTGEKSAIYLVDSSGGEARFLAEGSRPAWSPDGSRVLYDRGDSIFWALAPDGAQEEALVANAMGAGLGPGGRFLTFVRGTATRSSLYVRDLSTGAEHQLTPYAPAKKGR